MTPKTSQASNTQTGDQAIYQDDSVGYLGDTQTSQASNTQTGDQATNQDDTVGDLGDTQKHRRPVTHKQVSKQ